MLSQPITRGTAQDLKGYGLIDGIIEEGELMYSDMDLMLATELERLSKKRPQALVAERYQRFRKIDGLYQQ